MRTVHELGFVTSIGVPFRSSSPVKCLSRLTGKRNIWRPARMALGADNLLIVGAGTLGREIARSWLEAHPGAVVVGETRTNERHESLRELGVVPALIGEGEGAGGADDGEKFSRVVFCVPPSGSQDYAADVASTAARTKPGGVFVFTGSGGVYRDTSGVLNEDSPIAGENERTERLMKAERAALAVPEGRVVRLAGLYTLYRGAHRFYLRTGKRAVGQGRSIVSQIHYEDAGDLVAAALAPLSVERRVFLGVDSGSMSRREICLTALAHPEYAGCKEPEFDEEGPIVTKSYDNSETCRVLGWKPKYPSFGAFMTASAVNFKPAQ